MNAPRAPVVPERIRWAVDRLALAPAARVLEVGSGPGHAVALLAERLRRGVVTGIDRSALQVSRAREHNALAIAAGRARIERLTLAEAPAVLGERAFHALLAINVNAFWTEPTPSLESATRLLRPRGRLYLVYEPPSAARAAALRTSLAALLEQHGVGVLEVTSAKLGKSEALCITATPRRRRVLGER
jgi:SAM-dependent methyltransferase